MYTERHLLLASWYVRRTLEMGAQTHQFIRSNVVPEVQLASQKVIMDWWLQLDLVIHDYKNSWMVYLQWIQYSMKISWFKLDDYAAVQSSDLQIWLQCQLVEIPGQPPAAVIIHRK